MGVVGQGGELGQAARVCSGVGNAAAVAAVAVAAVAAAVAEGLVTLLLAGILAWRLPDSVLTASFLTTQDKSWLLEQLSSSSSSSSSAHEGSSIALYRHDSGLDQHEDEHSTAIGITYNTAMGTSAPKAAAAAAFDTSSSMTGHHRQHGGSSNRLPLRHLKHPGAAGTSRHKTAAAAGPAAGSNEADDVALLGGSSIVKNKHSTGSVNDSDNDGDIAAVALTLRPQSGGCSASDAAAGSSPSAQLSSWQQVVSTMTNAWILYLMLLKALKVKRHRMLPGRPTRALCGSSYSKEDPGRV
jgi:hypothetical protein